MVALPLHVANNYVLIHVLGLGYLGAAWATCLTAAYGLAMMLGYVAWTGQAARLWRGQAVYRSTWEVRRGGEDLGLLMGPEGSDGCQGVYLVSI